MEGNAYVFADRGISLGMALSEGAFDSAAELERFIDEYIAHSATRADMRQLHDDASRSGPALLARRLDTEAIGEAALGKATDALPPRAGVILPLPALQGAAIGKVTIPIAHAAVFIGKFVPIAGSLLVLSEVVTGPSIAGLGEGSACGSMLSTRPSLRLSPP